MEKKEEKITLIKGKEKREFSKAAAEIAMDHFGWANLPTPPPEILKGTGPIPLKRKIEPPVITADNTPSEPKPDAGQPEVKPEEVKPEQKKRPLRKK